MDAEITDPELIKTIHAGEAISGLIPERAAHPEIRSIERVDAAALEKAYREGYANGYVNGLDDAHRWETGGGSNRHKERDTEDAWLASDAKASTEKVSGSGE